MKPIAAADHRDEPGEHQPGVVEPLQLQEVGHPAQGPLGADAVGQDRVEG